MNPPEDQKPESFSSLHFDKEALGSPMEDYMEIMMQMAMVMIFGISFPLAGTLFWIMNFLEIRVDLVK